MKEDYKNTKMGSYHTTHFSKNNTMAKRKFIDVYVTKPCAFLGIAYSPGDFGKLTEEKFKLAKQAGCAVTKSEGEKLVAAEKAEKGSATVAKKKQNK